MFRFCYVRRTDRRGYNVACSCVQMRVKQGSQVCWQRAVRSGDLTQASDTSVCEKLSAFTETSGGMATGLLLPISVSSHSSIRFLTVRAPTHPHTHTHAHTHHTTYTQTVDSRAAGHAGKQRHEKKPI